MEYATLAGNYYTITSKSGCSVTDATGTLNETVEAGKQLTVQAPSDKLIFDDEQAIIFKANFKRAALALGLLGGGESSGLPAGYTRVEYLEVAKASSQCIPTAMVDVWGYKISFEVWGQDLLSIGGVVAYDTEGNMFSRNFLVYSQYDLPLMQFFISKQVNCYQEWGWAEKKRNFVYNDADYSVFRDGVPMRADAYDTGVVYQRCDKGFCILGKKNWVNNFIDSKIGVRQGVWKFWNPEGELKGHYIPALDPTGAPCMYDIVTREAFYNAGTGDFLYPGKEEQATTYSLRKPRMYAQKTEHGIRRLYHVPKGYNGTPEEYAAENGFKVLVETPQPEEGYWAPVWHEREDCIELEWVETEPPAEQELLTETE